MTPHRSRLVALLAMFVAATMLVSGCGGSSDKPAAKEKSPAEVMARAKQLFDDSKSVHLALATSSTPPSGANGVLGATGDLTHAPAYKGDVKVVLSGLTATVPVTSVGGKVYAKLPLSTSYAAIDPTEYGAPDPADFADPANGLSSLLTRITGLKKGQQTRSGATILTGYSGTLAGAAVKKIIPSADAKKTYATTVGVDDKGYAETVKVTGVFFSSGDNVTYDVKFSGYGKDLTISPPS